MLNALKNLAGGTGGGGQGGQGGQGGAGVGGAVSGMFDMYAAQKRAQADREAENDARVASTRMANQWEMMNAPNVGDLSYDIKKEEYMGDLQAPGVYMPERLASQYEGIQADPRFQEAQMAAMGGMDDIIQGGGMTDMDRLNNMRAMQAAEQQAAAQQADITQDMARRGMGGSGQEMLQKLVGSQGAVDRAAMTQQDTQAQAQQRALQALMQKGNMATGFRDQDVGEQQMRAAGREAVDRMNLQNMMGQKNLGTEMDWRARQRNLDTRQGIAGRTADAQTAANKTKGQAAGQAYAYGAHKLGKSQGIREGMRQEEYASDQRKAKYQEDFTKGMGEMFGGAAGSAAGSA